MSALTIYAVLLLLLGVYLRRRRSSIKYLRGPPSPSWLLGNEYEIRHQKEVGDLDFAWVREYGTAFRIKGCYNEDVLMTADPRALQYIFHTSGYRFPKRQDVNQSVKLLNGKGILWASGEMHQRHRKIMNPAFTAPQLRGFLPLFQRTASSLTQKWKDEIQNGTQVFNVSRWLARATLDAIGETAFDYHFGALNDARNELSKSFENLFVDSVLYPPKWDLLFKALWRYIPSPILQYVEYIPTREYRRFRQFRLLSSKVAAGLVEQKSSVMLAEGVSRDVMSILVHSNAAEDPQRRLEEEEMLAQMSTLMLAGHETTASTLTWWLYELSRHPEDQQKIREEIAALREKTRGRDFTMTDLDTMTFTMAAMKEVLRLHPIVPALVRTASQDDIIPLSMPIITQSGETITEIPVNKGQNITISICAYNRLPSLWGDDADEWNPKRFLENNVDKQTSVGVIGNLMTFSAGIRACIGWRFALIELQALLVELIENFEFNLPKGNREIQRVPAGLMIPMIKGKMSEGVQMPLQVSMLEG